MSINRDDLERLINKMAADSFLSTPKYEDMHPDIQNLIRYIFMDDLEDNARIDFSACELIDIEVEALMIALARKPEQAKKVISINLSDNMLSELFLAKTLINLQHLDVSENELCIAQIPAELRELREIHLSSNLLTLLVIPHGLIKLKVLDVHENILLGCAIPELNMNDTKFVIHTDRDVPLTLNKKQSTSSSMPPQTKRARYTNSNAARTSENSNPTPITQDIFIQQFIVNYWTSYDLTVDPTMLDDDQLFITPEERLQIETQFKRDLTQKLSGMLTNITDHEKLELLSKINTWRDPEQFNLHPTKNRYNIYVSGSGIKFVTSRFSIQMQPSIALRTGIA